MVPRGTFHVRIVERAVFGVTIALCLLVCLDYIDKWQHHCLLDYSYGTVFDTVTQYEYAYYEYRTPVQVQIHRYKYKYCTTVQ